jgi:hypothetical protein
MSEKGEMNKILQDIAKTGYPLEIDVIDSLMKKGWSVVPQFIYHDQVTNAIRTIDCVSYPGREIGETLAMALECKTSKKPWVFYASPLSSGSVSTSLSAFDLRQIECSPGQNVLYSSSIFSLLSPLFSDDAKWWNKLDSEQRHGIEQAVCSIHHFHESKIHLAHSCYVAFRGEEREDKPDDFQRAVHQIKGACFQITQNYPSVPLIKTIVHRGKMFEYLKTESEPRLEPLNHLFFSTFWFQPHFSGKYMPPEYSYSPMIIDVVQDAYFSNYLDLLHPDIDAVRILVELIKEINKK